MSDIRYNDLLFHISEKLDENHSFERLKYMCRGRISTGIEINNARALFDELERRNHLGIDSLDNLKELLRQLEEWGLLGKVIQFESKREELMELQRRVEAGRSARIVSSVQWAGEKILGAVKLHCNFRTLGGGVIVVGAVVILRKCTTLEEFMTAFTVAVLPAANTLRAISEGSLCFTVQAENLSALQALWELYQDGSLQSRLQRFLVTEEINQLAGGQQVRVTADISEQEYLDACLDLRVSESTTVQIAEVKRHKGACRRSSDSNLYVKDAGTEMESLLQDARLDLRGLEKKYEELLAQLTEARITEAKEFSYEPVIGELRRATRRKLSRRLQNDVKAYSNVREAFGLNIPGYRPRAFEEVITLFPRTPVKVLKDVFETLQLYDLVELLENAEVNCTSLQLKGTMQEVKTLRKTDKRQTTYHSNVAVLMLHDPNEYVDSIQGIKTFFQDLNEENDVTIVHVDWKKWRAVFWEVEMVKSRLQKHGQIELWELMRLRKLKQLREVREARETELRLTELKVLRMLRKLWEPRESELSKLDELIESKDVEELKEQIERGKRELNKLREKIQVEEREKEREAMERQREATETMGKLGALRMRLMKLLEKSAIDRREMERWEKELKDPSKGSELVEKLEEQRRQYHLWDTEAKDTLFELMRMSTEEAGKVKMRTSIKTVHRWIQTKEMFTFYVVFDLLGRDVGQEHLFEELKGLPNKAKLVISCHRLPAFPETLVVSGSPTSVDIPVKPKSRFKISFKSSTEPVSGCLIPNIVTDVYKIFTKRWETMDLLSMMEELRRIVGGIQIQDGLSSSLRFKKLQVKES